MNTKKIHFCFTIAVALGMMGFTSCDQETISFASETVLAPFDTLVLNAVFEVALIQGDTFSLKIEGDDRVASSVEFSNENNTLTLNNSNVALWMHPRLDPPKLIITFKNLSFLHAEETCHIYSPDTIRASSFGITIGAKLNYADLLLDCDHMYYWNTSPTGGVLNISGRADFLQLYNGILMAVNASSLHAHQAVVQNGSKSDIHVWVDQKLEYSISGTGNIFLSGSPAEIIKGSVTSTGHLIQ